MENCVGRFVSFLVVFVGLFIWSAVAASSQTLSLDDQTATMVGGEITFTLSIDYPSSESREIQAVTIDVDFDQAVLTYDSHTRGSLVDNWPVFDVSNPQDGQLRVAGLTFTVGDGLQPGDSGAIVQLHFTVTDMANTTLTISAQDDLAAFGTRSGQFTFELLPANNPPMASDDMGATVEGQSVMIDVLANDEDADGEQLTVTAVTQGDDGTVAISSNGATVTYTPDAGFTGSDDFTYTVSDGTDVATAMVTVTVTAPPPPMNNAPVAMDDEADTNEGESVMIDVLANDSDADRDSLTITDATDGNNGTVNVATDGSSVTYVPNTGFGGEDQFMYTVSDGQGGTDTAAVMVDVMEVDEGDGDGGTRRSSGGGGCALNPGAPFDPTLVSILTLLMGVYFVRRFTWRRPRL